MRDQLDLEAHSANEIRFGHLKKSQMNEIHTRIPTREADRVQLLIRNDLERVESESMESGGM